MEENRNLEQEVKKKVVSRITRGFIAIGFFLFIDRLDFKSQSLKTTVLKAVDVVIAAPSRGFDPFNRVNCSMANDLNMRVYLESI